jgi:hypothetical protein
VKVVDIPYAPGGGPVFETTTILHVTGTQGSTITKYFVLAANGKGGVNSAYSNEASYGFVIPYGIPAAPFNLIIKTTVVPVPVIP